MRMKARERCAGERFAAQVRSFTRFTAALLLGAALFAFPSEALAQNDGYVEGRVTEAGTGQPIPGATVKIVGQEFGTAAGSDGRFRRSFPEGSYQIRVSSVGFAPEVYEVTVLRDETTRLDARLSAATVDMEGVTVEAEAAVEASVFRITPQEVQNIPTPIPSVFAAVMTQPGVVTNNELSSQYSVRGGGFNENLIFLNGFEVYLPFRPRQGEQEGIGLLNPELTSGITFYTGGFPARYGGKLSSALAVEYDRPEAAGWEGSAYASTLDAGAALKAGLLDGRLGLAAGFRKAQPGRFFGTQELKGSYQPDYTDVQATAVYRFAPGHELDVTGLWAQHEFRLDPSSRLSYFGTISLNPRVPSNFQGFFANYSGDSEEIAGYGTTFVGARLLSRLSDKIRLDHGLALFDTEETEDLLLKGDIRVTQVDPGSDDPDDPDSQALLAANSREDFADNRVFVRTLTAQGRYSLVGGIHAAEAGWSFRRLQFEDRILEKSKVAYVKEGIPDTLIVDQIDDNATLSTSQVGVYVQDALDLHPTSGRFLLTAGLRADYYAFNDEWTVSPRLGATYKWTTQTTLLGSVGVYHQAPTYRELRGTPEPGCSSQAECEAREEGETDFILGALNRDLASQRSVQFVAGVEHLLVKRQLWLRAEAYYKRLSNLVSYDIENVRVQYSGENDSDGAAYGLDMQLRGEFVPGSESWVNYSYLRTTENFRDGFETEYISGTIDRPTDQRHTFSLYVQDYIPRDPSWKIHLRALYGSGLPYTPPVSRRDDANCNVPDDPNCIGNAQIQVPGPRNLFRYDSYKRLDMGVTKTVELGQRGAQPIRLEFTGEVLNVFDMTNTVAYSYSVDSAGIWRRIPTRLTPRTFNVRFRLVF